jgi:hypothetical protein
MANGPKLISSTTLTSEALSVTLSSIPQTYNDLYLVCHTRNPSNENPFRININGTGNLHYSKSIGVYPSGSPFSSQNPDGTGKWQMYGVTQGSGIAAGLFGVNELYFRGYSETALFKTAIGYSVATTQTGGNQLGYHGFNWDSRSAITSITFTTKADTNFAVGTTFDLYGIKVD